MIHSKIDKEDSKNAPYVRKSTKEVIQTHDTVENQRKSDKNASYILKSTKKVRKTHDTPENQQKSDNNS